MTGAISNGSIGLIRSTPANVTPAFDSKPKAAPFQLRHEDQEVRANLGPLPQGGTLHVGLTTTAPPLRPGEAAMLRKLTIHTRDMINRAVTQLSHEPWSPATEAAARRCFLMPPGPIPHRTQTDLQHILRNLQHGMAGNVTIKLLELDESEALKANGITARRKPDRRRLEDVVVKDRWTGEIVAMSPPYISRDNLDDFDLSQWALIHEKSHQAGATDLQRLGGTLLTGLVDREKYLQTGKVSFMQKPKDLRQLMVSADAWTGFVSLLAKQDP